MSINTANGWGGGTIVSSDGTEISVGSIGEVVATSTRQHHGNGGGGGLPSGGLQAIAPPRRASCANASVIDAADSATTYLDWTIGTVADIQGAARIVKGLAGLGAGFAVVGLIDGVLERSPEKAILGGIDLVAAGLAFTPAAPAGVLLIAARIAWTIGSMPSGTVGVGVSCP